MDHFTIQVTEKYSAAMYYLNYRQQINYVVCNLRLERKVWWHVRQMKRKNEDL